MADRKQIFLKESEKKAFDQKHRQIMLHNMAQYEMAAKIGKTRLAHLEMLRQRAYSLKHKSLWQIEKYLLEFESNFQRNGGKVIWALDAEDAVNEIIKLLKNEQIDKVVKSKSMTAEEIDLNVRLEKKKIQVIETDLGEFIVQQAGEKPYHIVTPAIHKNKEDVSAMFHEKYDLPEHSSPQEVTAFVRQHLRSEFRQAGAGITGANFLIADTGSIAVTENEGNALLSMAFPKLHIVIAGIEKVIPSAEELDLFWPLLATHGTGQLLTAYNSLISGPAKNGKGPSQMVVILLDNGRTSILAKTGHRAALSCIRCGACLNVCPVYKNIGGHAYDTTYSGPIGAVITPLMKGMREYGHLSYASTICGACTEVCPVKIPLHQMLVLNRKEFVEAGLPTSSEKFMLKNSTRVMLKRSLLDMPKSGTKNKVLKYFVAKQWGPHRILPEVAKKSFSQLWKDQQSEKKE